MNTPAQYEGAKFWADSHDKLCRQLWDAMGDRALPGRSVVDQVVDELRRLWALEQTMTKASDKRD